jgi:membrane associated rhomboid family serine protease
MLLIPIAQEDNVVRRVPWVSIAILALNFVVFLGLSAAESGQQGRVEQALQRFFAYLEKHPQLEVAPELAERLRPDLLMQLEQHRDAALRELDELQQERLAQDQAELDTLARALLEAIESAPARRLGYIPARGGLATALSSLFVHGGWLHLLGNMLFFFLSGPFLEDRFGRVFFSIFYLASGLASIGVHAAASPESSVPLVGASGAIAGVMGGFLVRLGAARIRFLLLPVPILPMWRYKPVLPAFVVLPLWFAEQLFYASSAGPESGVAFWAHVGGFVFGVLAALFLKLTRLEERYIHPQIEAQTTIEQHPALEQALDARLSGDYQAARTHLDQVLREQPDNLDAWSESYELALAVPDAARLGHGGTRLLELLVRKGEHELALELALDARWRALADVPPRFLLAVANHLERLGDRRSAIEVLELQRDAGSDPLALRALARHAELLARAGDRAGARRAYERCLAHPACRDPWPATIERALAQLSKE